MKNRPLVSCLGALAFGVLSPCAAAQTASTLSFQAQLHENGIAFSGTVDLVFRIYDAESGGALVDLNGDGAVNDVIGEDAQEVTGVEVTDGLLTTKWGPVSPKAFDGSARWVEVTANGEMLSRFEIVTPPAVAEQLNAPNSGEVVAETTEEGSLGVGADGARARLEVRGQDSVMGTGIIASTPGNVMITGAGTAFASELSAGDMMIVTQPITQFRMITNVMNDSTLFVESPFDPELPAQAFTFRRPVMTVSESGGQVAMTVTAQRRVGIRTSAPRADLDVQGTFHANHATFLSIEELEGPWEQAGATSGYLRLGDVQICWGRFISPGIGGGNYNLFAQSFIDDEYSVATSTESTLLFAQTTCVVQRGNDGFRTQSFDMDGNYSSGGGTYIAIGRWR